ncbi:exodeoxyribonuclease X C-terminal domain-containing protein [Niastella caeni]
MPFGTYKGKTLKYISEVNPGYLEWWKEEKKVVFSNELLLLITYYKNIGQ